MLTWARQQQSYITDLTLSHLYLSVVPILVSLAISIPVGALIHRSRRWKAVVLSVSGILYTVPSLAIFVILPQVIGTQILDRVNVVIALVVYSTSILIRTVVDGLDSVPAETEQAAVAIGYRPLARMLLVQLPVAVPVIAAGLRVAVVTNVSIASIASLIGVEQLGQLFTQGAQQLYLDPVVVGVVLSLALAAVLDLVVLALGRLLTPWRPPSRVRHA
ncbi:ABC transporter permease [Streptomyces sp. S3(2020)]|uniref:ABC transporter permease n=1 Tax=Streptomyces sp. S3(2020) TaxID=2732044 RepID=UPI0014898AF3|nr:ABC transporter permease [Streptomyces sp. S3(2020)]NNN29174.1 ABC transporter permease [Streptomyces sp. S3(2020)]